MAAKKKKNAMKAPAKKATAKKAPAKKAPAKKAPAKKAPTKKTAKKTGAKKAPAKKTGAKKAPAKKAPAKKAPAKKTGAKKAPAKKTAKKTRQPPSLTPRRSLDLSALAAAYRDGDALAHPVTAEQMAEVRKDGLRSDDSILHVEDDADVAPCRLVDHGEGRYSLCLDDFRMPRVALFDERGLQGGGYTWEALSDSLARLRRPELVGGLTYDSEAGMFVAIGTRPTLVALAHLIQEAMEDETLLRAALDTADPDRLE
jgi:hypothetical protein